MNNIFIFISVDTMIIIFIMVDGLIKPWFNINFLHHGSKSVFSVVGLIIDIENLSFE